MHAVNYIVAGDKFTSIIGSLNLIAGMMSKLQKRVWDNNNLTNSTKMQVYRACVLSTLLYSSEAWTTYATQEKRLNSFHLRCLRRILGIRWQDLVPNTKVLERAGLLSIFALLAQRRLRWLGHVRRLDDSHIPKDLLYGELADGARSRGRPSLRYKDSCKRDLKGAGIDLETWESLAGHGDRLFAAGWREPRKNAPPHCSRRGLSTRRDPRRTQQHHPSSAPPAPETAIPE